MSKISQARNDLKRKLSFNDYSTPSDQHDIMPLDKCADAPTCLHDSATEKQSTSDTAYTRTSTLSDNYHNAGITTQPYDSTISPSKQCNGMPIEQHNENPLCNHVDVPSRHTTSNNQEQQHEAMALPVYCCNADMEVRKAKIKATYYLSEDDHQAITDMYIKRLQNKKKTDKSALISEAIKLLYKREMR